MMIKWDLGDVVFFFSDSVLFTLVLDFVLRHFVDNFFGDEAALEMNH